MEGSDGSKTASDSVSGTSAALKASPEAAAGRAPRGRAGRRPILPAVPAVGRGFTGRDAEVTRGIELLGQERVVALVGPAGIGKSEIVRAIGLSMQRSGADVAYVDLDPYADADSAFAALAAALALEPAAEAEGYAAQFTPAVIILDGLDGAIEEDPNGTRGLMSLLRDLSPCRFLITGTETAMEVLTGIAAVVSINGLSTQAGDRLFREFSSVTRTGVSAALGGNPQAIRIAAGLPPDVAFEDALGVEAPADSSVLLRLLRTAYSALPAGRIRAVFALFGDLPAGATDTLLSDLLGPDKGLVDDLVRRGFVQRDVAAPGARDGLSSVGERWRMPRALRQAASGLTAEGLPALRTRLATYLRQYAALWGDSNAKWGSDPILAARSIASELPNLHAALDRAAGRRLDYVAEVTDSLQRYYVVVADPESMQRLRQGASASAAIGRAVNQASCLQSLAEVHVRLGALDSAKACLTEALDVYRDIGSRAGEAACLRLLGDVRVRLGEAAEAVWFLEEALPLFEVAGDRIGMAQCARSLGIVFAQLRQFARARVSLDDALAAFRTAGDRAGVAGCLLSLGELHLSLEEFGPARDRYTEALSIYRQAGDAAALAACLQSLGEIRYMTDDYAGALACFAEAVPIFRDLGSRAEEADCLRWLGDVHGMRGDDSLARTSYEEARAILEHADDALALANCVKSLGDLQLRLGDHEKARASFTAALKGYQQAGSGLGVANCVHGLGEIDLLQSDYNAARARFEEALAEFQSLGDRLGEANCVKSLGDLHRESREFAPARERYEVALGIYALLGDRYSQAGIHERLAHLAAAQMQATEAISQMELARALFEESGNTYWADQAGAVVAEWREEVAH
ncbi:MAG: tetratricopeptide repeat protein [Capsulimonadaceae bacterium]